MPRIEKAVRSAKQLTWLLSECGNYFAERSSTDHCCYQLYDRGGKLLGRTGYWGNLLTSSRWRFKVSLLWGPDGQILAQPDRHTAVFSGPRYPRWFRRRWVACWDLWIDALDALVKSQGCEVLVAFKPDINCFSHIGFRATAAQASQIDAELSRLAVEWNGPPVKRGQWNIERPFT